MISAICVSCRDEVAKAIRRAIGDTGGGRKRDNFTAPPWGAQERGNHGGNRPAA